MELQFNPTEVNYLWVMHLSQAHGIQKPKLSILIVTYNCPDDFEACMKSLCEFESIANTFEILVIENGKKNVDIMADLASKYGAQFISSSQNLGFGRANNVLASKARGDYFLCLNPDTIFSSSIIGEMLGYLDAHPDCGACGPLLENLDGSLQDSWAEPTSLIWDICEGHYLQGYYRKQMWKRKLSLSSSAWEVGFTSGACLCVRAQLWEEISGFDPDFFLNHEDVEICDRIRSKGYSVRVLRDLRLIHAEGKTQREDWSLYAYYRLHGKWLYISKRYKGFAKFLSRLIWWESSFLKFVIGSLLLSGVGRSRLKGFWNAMKWVASK